MATRSNDPMDPSSYTDPNQDPLNEPMNLYDPSGANPSYTPGVRPGSAPPSVQQHVQQQQDGGYPPAPTAPTAPTAPQSGWNYSPPGRLGPNTPPMPAPPGYTPSNDPITGTKNPDGSTSGTIDFGPMDVSKIDKTKAFAGLGTPDLYDHTQVTKLQQNLQQLGYTAQLGPADMYGRIDSMYINGQFTRIFDSSGNWEFVPDDGNWSAWGGPGDGGGGGGAGGAGGTGGAGTPGAGTGGADLQGLLAQMLAGQDTNRQGQFFDQLQGYIDQYGRPVTPDDPIIKAQTDAFRAQQTRGAEQGQAKLAEANAYKGTPTGTRDAGTQAGYEAAALNTGNFQANQMFQEQTQRRSALQNILSLYGGQLTAEQTRQLQSEIAAIDATLRNQGLVNQNAQFYDQLGLTAAEQEAILNAQLVDKMQP